jgi:putative hydrolase of the HAD superfamily
MKPDGGAPAICFDATGTLIETTSPVGEVYRRIAAQHGVDLPAWRLDDAFRRILRGTPPRGLGASVDARRRGEVAWWFEVIRQTFQATDSTARFDDFPRFAQSLFDAYQLPGAWRPRPGITEVLTALQARGCPLAVVSNFDHRLPKILENVDLAAFFTSIAIPSELGWAKPERPLFEAVAEILRRPVEFLTYVGDDAPDVLAAIAHHGMRVVDIRQIHAPAPLCDLLLDSNGVHPATVPRAR